VSQAIRDDLRCILGEYEAALQEYVDEGSDEAEDKLQTARKRLLELLQQVKIALPEA
jgi:ElaB/YqjD/DUF883 family membrane-anchored ribosome-binding protein